MTSPVAATVNSAGVSAPNYAAILSYLVSQFQAIYGADSYLGADSADGQWIGVIASAINDCNNAAIAVYNSFSPTTAQGNGLSSNVKLNGLRRSVGSFSTAPIILIGTANTIITNGQVQDTNGFLWALPSSVTIPASGTILVTATCTTIGAINAAENAINDIATPVLNWQSASNSTAAATAGNPVETDAQLRIRQSNSVALPSLTIFDGIAAAIAQVAGVTRVTPYENNTSTTNGNGIPANMLAFVVEGGAALSIAQAIAAKLVGIGTYTTGAGTQTFAVTDAFGYTKSVGFMQAGNGAPSGTYATIGVNISIHALTGYATSTSALITSALQSLLINIPIGGTVNVAQLIQAAMLQGTSQAVTFLIKSLTINSNGGAFQGTDISLAFNIASVPGTVTVSSV